MELIDNTSKTLKDDLVKEIKKNSKISIAAACFSVYAFAELKAQLKNIEELRFIFTSPTFTTEKAKKEKREFYIPRLSRENSLYGNEFEIKLKNKLNQKAIAKECADWICSKVKFKSNITNENMMGFINVDDKNYMPVTGFTTVDLGCERGNNAYSMIQKNDMPFSEAYLNLFNELWNNHKKLQDVTEIVIDNITTVYKENSPEFIYFITIYNIFSDYLKNISEDDLPNEATGFKDSKIWSMLYDFQKDAVCGIINKLERFNGCILADSVGLGKTFTALAVIKYYESRNKNVLVLCPKKLSNNWNTYRDNYKNNPLVEDRLNYKVLYHTDISRSFGNSNGTDLQRLRWDTYDLVVIDESHNFRNGGKLSGENKDKENRYLKLLNKVIKKGVKTKVLMLSATPVNNRFNDLKNQLQLAYEGDSSIINKKLDVNHSVDDIFKNAQKMFNMWSKLNQEERTTERLLRMLDFDFFEVLDNVTIARSRKHIEKYYNTEEIEKFPERLKPIALSPKLTDLESAINYNQIFEQLMLLNLSIYTPSHYILESRQHKYSELFGGDKGLTQAGREEGIRRLMAINLMKRMESSVFSFKLTIIRVKDFIDKQISLIDSYDFKKSEYVELDDYTNINDFDEDDQNSDDLFLIGRKIKIDICDMDYKSWKYYLQQDRDIFELLILMVSDITPKHDCKLQEIKKSIDDKINKPINDGNKKVLIFTAFADTANYLYQNLSTYIKNKYNLNVAMITGSGNGKSTLKSLRCDLNSILTCFSPISKDKYLLYPDIDEEIDVLIATDCISEGQNLQDCDFVVNYDIHWNPVRIIQRFGRVDRIGSKNNCIQLVNFWPDVSLDEYINLKNRVETRMAITVMTSTGIGYDNPISEEKTELEYRKAQLKKLHEEVVDLEDMSSGISIMDLGLNEFRIDAIDFIKKHPDLDSKPKGLNAIVSGNDDNPSGVIYVLKNIHNEINISSKNRLHPYYMVYISNDGNVICDHLSPKELLDTFRNLCKGKTEPDKQLCNQLNEETNNGKKMDFYSELLQESISSIIHIKEESDVDDFLSGNDISFLSNKFKGLDDFELISFLIIK